MKCENCGENEANIKYTQIINGVKTQMNLCEKCAKDLGVEDIDFSMPINFSSFLGDIFDIYEDTIPSIVKPQILTCSKCNMSYNEFLQTGKFGCEQCYEDFKIKLAPILKNIHGANKHIGRIGKFEDESVKFKEYDNLLSNKENKKDTNKSKIDILNERLKKEIEEERYEDAAKTRDEIKKIN